jgi:hypothetical protein
MILTEVIAEFEEVHHSFRKLWQDSERFFEFLYMSVATFDCILSRVKYGLWKKCTNFYKPVSPEERLYVTLR